MPSRDRLARVTWIAWTGFIVLLAVLPLGAVSSREPDTWFAIRPFGTISHALARGLTPATIVSVVGNVVAFVPIGLLAPRAWPRCRTWPAALALGLGVSLSIELAQLAISIAIGIPYRRADVDDLILNSFGTAIGYGIWRGFLGRT